MSLLRLSALLAFSTVLGSSVANAQTFQDAPSKATPVYVTRDGSTGTLKGQLLNLSPETLTLLQGTDRQDIPLQDIRTIEIPGDSVKNGAIIGASIFGGVAALAFANSGTTPGFYVFAVTLDSLLGAAIGTAFDVMVSGQTVIYDRDAQQPRNAGTPRPNRAIGVAIAKTVKF